MNELEAQNETAKHVRQHPAVGTHLHETVRRMPAVKTSNPTRNAWIFTAVMTALAITISYISIYLVCKFMIGG